MASHRDQERGFRREEPAFNEDSPLLRPMSTTSAGALCTCGVITMLVMCWCVLDFWNRKAVPPFKTFSYPLTLAFLQFAFMGMVFLTMYFVVTQHRPADLRGLSLTSDRRWLTLVVSHVFSTFWLQSLMMPSQVMSLGVFAATRAVEIPTAAALRPVTLGHRFGKKTLQTTLFGFASSCLLYFSYAQLAGCVCILSGNGVTLSGLAFWIVYAMMLAMPATNAVYQEAIMVQNGMHPFLILASQNIFALLIFGPVLFVSHMVGWEDIGAAIQAILAYQEVFMLVTWLCAQIALTSLVMIMLICVADSFWAIALRPVRVVFWGMISLIHFYMSSGLALSIAAPRSSFWSFVILCGCGCAAAAIYTDRKAEDDAVVDKSTGPLPSGKEKVARTAIA